MKRIEDEYSIREHPGRLQPFTVWREGGREDYAPKALRFCHTRSEAELFIETDIERRLR